MNLEPIANRLEEEGVGTPGKTIFINFMPANVKQGVLLRDYFGGTPVIPELPGFYKASFMLIVRTTDMASGQKLMADAITALTFAQEKTLNETLFRYSRARGLPFTYAPSPGGNIEIAVNMDCCFIDAPA